MKIITLLILNLSLAAHAAPTPFPVFLKSGFSSILEFSDTPTRVVLGDGQYFQVEKLDRSLVLKTLVPYASTNMFVYFKSLEPRLFVLTASEDAEPTYYRKFDPPVAVTLNVGAKKVVNYVRDARLVSSRFDSQKDYLTVEVELTADSKEIIKPQWNLVRLSYNKNFIVPFKLWAERQDVQKDSRVKARFIFAKPNIARNLKGVSLIVPIQGAATPFYLNLAGGGK